MIEKFCTLSKMTVYECDIVILSGCWYVNLYSAFAGMLYSVHGSKKGETTTGTSEWGNGKRRREKEKEVARGSWIYPTDVWFLHHARTLEKKPANDETAIDPIVEKHCIPIVVISSVPPASEERIVCVFHVAQECLYDARHEFWGWNEKGRGRRRLAILELW